MSGVSFEGWDRRISSETFTLLEFRDMDGTLGDGPGLSSQMLLKRWDSTQKD